MGETKVKLNGFHCFPPQYTCVFVLVLSFKYFVAFLLNIFGLLAYLIEPPFPWEEHHSKKQRRPQHLLWGLRGDRQRKIRVDWELALVHRRRAGLGGG